MLRDAGYATAITGKWQINDLYDQRDALRRHGFDEHLVWTGALAGEGLAEQRWKATTAPAGKRAIESRYWDPIVFRNGEHSTLTGQFGPDVYLDYLVDFMARNREKPFVAYYACPFVHVPTVPTPLTPDKNAPEREQFIGMVRSMDAQVSRLEKELERLGLRENTILLFMTDNGTPLKLSGTIGGKQPVGGLGTMNENGLDVPLTVNCILQRSQIDMIPTPPSLLDRASMRLSFARSLGIAGMWLLAVLGSFAAEARRPNILFLMMSSCNPMQNLSRHTLALLMASAMSVMALNAAAPADSWWQETKMASGLEQELGSGGEVAWSVVGGATAKDGGPFTREVDAVHQLP